MHEVLFKHFTTLKLYESNLAKFSKQIEEVIRDEEQLQKHTANSENIKIV